MEEGETSMSEDQILLTTLGHRSGYQKGMGYGVEAPRNSKYPSNIEESENALQTANNLISTHTVELAEQKEKTRATKKK